MLLSLLDMKALSPSHDETRTSASNGTEEEEEEERGYLRGVYDKHQIRNGCLCATLLRLRTSSLRYPNRS